MSICKECGGITSEYSGTPCTCPVVVPPAPTVVETTFADKMRLRMKACDVCHGTMQWQPPDMSEPAACLECFDWNKAINEVERLQRDLATLTRQRDGLKEALVAVRGWIGHMGSDQVVGDIIEKALQAAKGDK